MILLDGALAVLEDVVLFLDAAIRRQPAFAAAQAHAAACGGEADAQVDRSDPEQADILSAATHFNPVDLACSLRDARGRPHDARRFADPDAVIVARKSFAGRDLLALERPGLWNGAMARWATVFVEVPLATFSPVKTLFDLLRPEHQPE